MASNVLRTLRCQLGSYRVAYCIVLRIVRGAAPRPARGDRSDPAIVIFFSFSFFLFIFRQHWGGDWRRGEAKGRWRSEWVKRGEREKNVK